METEEIDTSESVLPMERPAAADLPIMKPREACERLMNGERLQDVRIERMTFKGEFAHAVEMRNVTLVNPRFEYATFKQPVAFTACTLVKPRFGRHTIFEQGLNLSQSTLVRAGFEGVTVRGLLRCDNIQSRGTLKAVKTRLEGGVRFWEANFMGWVEWTECEFLCQADFRSLNACEGFIAHRCRFEGEALFRGATICKKWDGAGSHFAGLLDFSKAKLHDFVYLEAIEQGPNQRFAFANAVGDRFLIRIEQLQGRIASEENGQHELAMHEYGHLKRSYQALHRFHEEDCAFYRFKVNQRRAKPRSWSRPWTKVAEFFDWLLLDLGCGYGTNPYRAVMAALVIILLFGLIYVLDVESLRVEQPPFGDQPVTSWPNRFMIGMQTSVSVFTSGLSGIRDIARGWINVPLIIESLLGTLLWGLFIVAFSRKVIR